MYSSRSGVSLLSRCSTAAALEGSTTAAAFGAGRWLNRTQEDSARDRAASVSATSRSSGPYYSTPKMFDDLDRVMEPTWCDLWQDSNISTHPQNANWLENVTAGMMPSSTPYNLSKQEPDQMTHTGGVLVPEIAVSSCSRGSDCDDDGTPREFCSRNNNNSVEGGGNTAIQFGDPSNNTLDVKETFDLEEESYSDPQGQVMEYDSKNGGGSHDAGFLGYDWASITDFDDLDGMFSSYSVQDDWAAENRGEISSSTDSGCSRSSSSHRVPENTIWEEDDEDCSPHHLSMQASEECQGDARAESSKRSRFWSMEDGTDMDEEKGDHASRLCSTSDWISDMEDNEMNCNPPAASSQQDSKSFDNLLSDQQNTRHDDFAVPFLPPFHVAKKQRYNESSDYDLLCNLRNAYSTASPGEMLSAIPTMTPLQKIGKLRCNQQMQATHAINQLQKQFDQQFPGSVWNNPHMTMKINHGSESSDSDRRRTSGEGTSRNSPQQETNTHAANEASDISFSGLSEAESALSELQHIISKLDDKFRTSIRDGLFRLASNAIESNSGYDTGTTSSSSMVDDEVTLAVGMMMKSMEA